ncbi:S8 family peptidase [Deinococcus cellulosilyticus]|uniref:Peptidase S8/S53 domain-containing protein n=1 Tax=Deinococcus cellulosilyticus (strain DSM 18568 / NBRC 106333 / KACC 11606 / 5516J-15) TaxID=1223518 RepID=A0A511N4E7_DEIC1|nr:S8 family serine peptidase [Deinococcus cellulosilyticus]GEM47712.1 hypothetical protein DC3_33470 [Deinococcus cellulosilyticus NBRC 106333 = KACC 11606]
MSHTSVLKRLILITTVLLSLASCSQTPKAPEATAEVQNPEISQLGSADVFDMTLSDRSNYQTTAVRWWTSGVKWWVSGTNSGLEYWTDAVRWWASAVRWWAEGVFLPAPDNSKPFKLINLDKAQLLAPNLGAGVNIALIDTGVDLNHPMLTGAVKSGWDYLGNDSNASEEGADTDVAYGHGTAVAGLIRQVAPKATITAFRVITSDGSGRSRDVAKAIYDAVNGGADIINMSVSTDTLTSSVYTAMLYAASKKVLIVASGGNSGGNQPLVPALQLGNDPLLDLSGLSVGSVNGDGSSVSWNNKGNEVLAPGVNLFTAYPGQRVVYGTGSSFSAPLVTGALALALGENANNWKLTTLAQSTSNGGIIDMSLFLKQALK